MFLPKFSIGPLISCGVLQTYQKSNDVNKNNEHNSVSYQNILQERKSASRNNINVSFSMQEAKIVVDMFDKKEKEISKIKKLVSHNTQILDGSDYSASRGGGGVRGGGGGGHGVGGGGSGGSRDGPMCLCGAGIYPGNMKRAHDNMNERKERMKKKAYQEQKKGATANHKNDYQDETLHGMKRDEEDRIVNGYLADSRPWFAAIGSNTDNLCGGALINQRFIL